MSISLLFLMIFLTFFVGKSGRIAVKKKTEV